MHKTNSIVYAYHILLIYHSVDGHQAWFHNFAVVSYAEDMKHLCDVVSWSSNIPEWYSWVI